MKINMVVVCGVVTMFSSAYGDTKLLPKPVAYEETLSYKIDACDKLNSALASIAAVIEQQNPEDLKILDPAARIADAKARRKPFELQVLKVSNYCLGKPVKAPTDDDWRFVQALASRKGNADFSLTPSEAWSKLDGTASGGAGASWSSAVVEGVAAFLIRRAQAELMASFLVKLKTSLCDDAGNGKALVPNTCAAMSSFSKDSFPQAGTALRAALRADIPHIARRVVGNSCGPSLFLEVALELNDQLERGHAPFEALAALATVSAPGCAGDPAIKRALTALGTGVGLLMKGRSLIEVLPELWKNEWLVQVNAVLCPAAAAPGCKLKVTKQHLERLHLLLVRLEELRQQVTEKLEVGRFNIYALAATEVLAIAAEINPDYDSKISALRAVLLAASTVRDSVRARDYAAAVVAVMALLRELESFDPAAKVALPATLTKYVPLLVELTAAENPEAVTKAIEAAALPVGSWSNKRVDEATTIGVNAYLGLHAGGEVLGGSIAGANTSKVAWEGALFAPVGLEVSRGFGSVSLGVFVSVIDLGALVSYRISDPAIEATGDVVSADAESSPSYSIEQVFSPGMHVVVGVSKSFPLSIGAGFMLTPKLRELEYTVVDGAGAMTLQRESLPAFRFGGFLSIDLPVLGF